MRIATLLLTFCFCQPALAITIATGTTDGTYYQIAQDIQRVAAKDGIPVELIQTNGSFDNINLLGSGKVDLAILQLDVLKLASDVMQQAGLRALDEFKVILNLYFEEIHVIATSVSIRSLADLQGKKVAMGPEKSGSALTGSVLLALHNIQVEKVYDSPADALRKLESGGLDALIFVGGAPVPAFEKLDNYFHFVQIPANADVEQVYQKTKIGPAVYAWTGETETYAVPSVIMTRARNEAEYATTLQKLVLCIIANKEHLDATGHPKWKTSFVRTTLGSVGYRPTTDLIGVINALDSYGYRLIKK